MCDVLINEFIDCKFRVVLADVLTYISYFLYSNISGQSQLLIGSS